MSAEIDMSNGRINMAKTEDVLVWWEREGHKAHIIEPDDDIFTISEKAGLVYDVQKIQTFYKWGEDEVGSSAFSLVRSDTGKELGCGIGKVYRVHQPQDIAATMDRICKIGGFSIKTAGALVGGARIWMLAERPGSDIKIAGNEILKPYLTLATDYSGKMATQGSWTNVMVVCNNTFQAMLSESRQSRVTLSHKGDYNEDHILEGLGILDTVMEENITNVKRLIDTPLKGDDLVEFIMGVGTGWKELPKKAEDHVLEVAEGIKSGKILEFKIHKDDKNFTPEERKSANNAGKIVQNLVKAYIQSPGQKMKCRQGTAWGAFNAVTYYSDHLRTAKGGDEGRLLSTTEGSASVLKNKAAKVLLAA